MSRARGPAPSDYGCCVVARQVLTVDRQAAPDRRLAMRLILAAVAGGVAMIVCYLLMVRTTLGERFDRAAYLGALGQNSTVVAVNTTLLQHITADSFSLVLVIIVVVGLVRRRLLLGLAAAFGAGAAVLVTHVLKDHVLASSFLGRPDTFNTFPSGHTATAVACAMALVLVAPPAWRGLAAVTAGAYGWITAAQVQSAGWHRPSDAIGAACVAFASITAVASALAWTRPVERSPGRPYVWAQVVLGAVAVTAAVIAGWDLARVLRILRLHSSSADSASVHHLAYLTGLAMTVDVVVLLLMALLALLGRVELDG